MARRAAGLTRGARKAEDTESGGSSNSFLGIVRPEAQLQPARDGRQPGGVPTEAAATPGGPAQERGVRDPHAPRTKTHTSSGGTRVRCDRRRRSLPGPRGKAAAPSGHPGDREAPARASAEPPSRMRARRWTTLSLFSLQKHHEFALLLDFAVPQEVFFSHVLGLCSLTW